MHNGDYYALILLSGMVFIVGNFIYRKIKPKPKAAPRQASDELDEPIMKWDDKNHLSSRNLVAGGIHAYGRTDAGKSSSLKKLAKAILRRNSSLLVLCPKRDEYLQWLKIAKSVGREDDVVLIDPDQLWRFNMLGHLSSGPAGMENVVQFLMEARSVIFRQAKETGGDSATWRKHEETAIRNAVVMLRIAGESITANNLHALLVSAPRSSEEIDSPRWQTGYCNKVIEKGHEAEKSSVEHSDFEQAKSYWLNVWSALGERTRGSILVGIAGTLNAMNTGLARELFGESTNISPIRAIEGCKIVVINMPPDIYGDLGMLANVGWKYLWQKDVLRRQFGPGKPITGIWGDEASIWVSDFDADYLSRCRSYGGFQVYITQSIASYLKVLGKDSEPTVDAMYSNFSHKLYFALGDVKTAEAAAAMCGRELQAMSGGSVQHSPFTITPPTGHQSHSSSFNEQYQFAVRPEEFMNGLRTGSPANDFQVDAILVRSGKPFASGYPMLSVTFDQRDS